MLRLQVVFIVGLLALTQALALQPVQDSTTGHSFWEQIFSSSPKHKAGMLRSGILMEQELMMTTPKQQQRQQPVDDATKPHTRHLRASELQEIVPKNWLRDSLVRI